MSLFNDSGAVFSDDRKYRYVLWRVWQKELPKVMFIGLNPSTANESSDDPTIRRVVGFAKQWGYGGVYMMNLFAIVSSKPEVLKTCDDPIGENDYWLNVISFKCGEVIFAWGDFKEATERSEVVKVLFPNAKALQINKNGTPKHPLYVRADIQPQPFSTPQP